MHAYGVLGYTGSGRRMRNIKSLAGISSHRRRATSACVLGHLHCSACLTRIENNGGVWRRYLLSTKLLKSMAAGSSQRGL